MNIRKKKQSTLLALLLVTWGVATVTVAQTQGVEPRTPAVQEAPRQEATTTACTAYNIVFNARWDGWCNAKTHIIR